MVGHLGWVDLDLVCSIPLLGSRYPQHWPTSLGNSPNLRQSNPGVIPPMSPCNLIYILGGVAVVFGCGVVVEQTFGPLTQVAQEPTVGQSEVSVQMLLEES